MKPYRHISYKPPAKNSVRAIAAARTFLESVRDHREVYVAELCSRYNLTPAVAEKELSEAKARRVGR